MTAISNQCPCAQRLRIEFVEDPAEPGAPADKENVVCFFCDRVLRAWDGKPQRPSYDDELAPGEDGQIIAARARAGLVRGRPIDNAPPREPKPPPPGASDPGRP